MDLMLDHGLLTDTKHKRNSHAWLVLFTHLFWSTFFFWKPTCHEAVFQSWSFSSSSSHMIVADALLLPVSIQATETREIGGKRSCENHTSANRIRWRLYEITNNHISSCNSQWNVCMHMTQLSSADNQWHPTFDIPDLIYHIHLLWCMISNA